MTRESSDAEETTARMTTAVGPRTARSPLTGAAGVLACVLIMLAGGTIGAQIVASQHGQPGPGATSLIAHLAGAVAGVVGYRLVSRRRGLAATAWCGALIVAGGLLLWFFWWAA